MFEFAIRASVSSFKDASYSLRKYLQSHAIESVLLGVSGGADSVLALHLLAVAASKLPGFRLYAAHVNFHLRGDESMRDEEFVRSLAMLYPDVTFFFKDCDTTSFARKNGVSIEMAARDLRHNWWRQLQAQYNIGFIATGHNANDNEETLMLNLLRGSSPAGLRGMYPLASGIFRPLLGIYRRDILRLLGNLYCREWDINNWDVNNGDGLRADIMKSILDRYPEGYVTDSSNLSSDFRRNFLRNEILPLLESRWEGMHNAFLTSLELQGEAAAIVERNVADVLSSERSRNGSLLSWATISNFPAPLTLIYHFGKDAGLSTATAREIADHIPEGEVCLTPGRRWILADGNEILTTPRGIELRRRKDRSYLTNLPAPEDITIEESEMSTPLMLRIKKAAPEEVYLPCPPEDYEWRTAIPGERIRLFPPYEKRTKLISDVYGENKVPTADRPHIAVLANRHTDETVWIPGLRRAGCDLILPDTTRVWHWSIPEV